ncbi:MAG: anhydro-N-acetylmuramic acid kinase [Pseudomonadota bacterium]
MSKITASLGLMSGTSMDGIDLALLKTNGEQIIERGPSGFFPYSPQTQEMLREALVAASEITERTQRPGNLVLVEEKVTSLHVHAVEAFLHENKLSKADIDLIGFHGQTVLHRPDKGLTVQLGDASLLTKETGIPTVYDLRANDMEHGGQGAPLVPVYHQALASNIKQAYANQKPVVFVNIGGISNVTYVGEALMAFDCGPGNALIDQWVQKTVGIPFDQSGMIAAEGRVDEAFVNAYLADSFFSKPAPKSLDRNDFKLPEATTLSVETVARSFARLTAESIFKSAEHFPAQPLLWVICGGGRQNPHIMEDLLALAHDTGGEVVSAEKAGFNGDAMEAEAWAYLAVRSLAGLPLTFPQTTGCSKAVSGGKLWEVKTI